MSKIYRGEMQDNLGNTIYPHTEAGLVYCSDGETVQEKLTGTAETLDGITGVSDSTELDDSTKLATSKAVNTLRNNVNSSLDDCKIISEGEGENTKYYLQKGADTASKKLLGKSTLYIKTGMYHDGGSNVYACTYISEDNKNWVEICKTPTVVHNFGSNVWKWSGTYTYGEN